MKNSFCSFIATKPVSGALIILMLLLIAQPGTAKQLKFQRAESDGNISLSYVWHDLKQVEQSWGFTLSGSSVNSVMNKFTVYQPDIAARLGYIAASKAATHYDPRQVRVKIRKYPGRIDIATSSDKAGYAQQVKRELFQEVNKARDEYLASNYYTLYKGPLGEQGVIPDHRRVTRESIELLKPLAKSMQEKFPNAHARLVTTWLLPFIQSIPYETQGARLNSAGVGYLTPSQVLDQNRGDCDSKVTLMATLMKALYPTLEMVIVYLPEHALLGIQVPYSKSEQVLNIDGANYVLAEVAGPALLPLGKVSESTAALLGGSFGHKKL